MDEKKSAYVIYECPPDEVDASRVKRMLVCAEYKAPSWIKYPRRFLFSTIFVLVNFIHVIYIIVKKVRIGKKFKKS